MAGTAHTAQIDLRFGDAAGKFLNFGIGYPGNFARERFHVFGPTWIRMNR
jgi:hypothetical protein